MAVMEIVLPLKCGYLQAAWRAHPYLLTHSIPYSPSSEGTCFSASQEIPRILWKMKVHQRVHNSPTPVPTLSQINPVRVPTPSLTRDPS
jgi:hypothetical protein